MHAPHGLVFDHFLSPAQKPMFVRDAEDWLSQIRKPPKPPGWNLPKGYCRFCADEIREDNGTRLVLKTAKRWHSWPEHNCLQAWKIATDPQFARTQVFLRDFGICAGCGCDTKGAPPDGFDWAEIIEDLKTISPKMATWGTMGLGKWELDHIVPLWVIDREEVTALKYWLLGNMQTLCDSCHAEKTGKEAANRAKMKRIESRGGLLTKKLSQKEKFLRSKARPGQTW